jgi:hypothetical protein
VKGAPKYGQNRRFRSRVEMNDAPHARGANER